MKKLLYLLLLTATISFAQDSTFTDCGGNIAPEGWLGDGFCDDNTYSWNGYLIDFNCAEFNYDGADCPIPILDTIYGCVNELCLLYTSPSPRDS